MLVWSMCEWSGCNVRMECASEMECASASLVNARVVRFFAKPKCANASLVNVRVVRFLRHRNVRVLVWSMCE